MQTVSPFRNIDENSVIFYTLTFFLFLQQVYNRILYKNLLGHSSGSPSACIINQKTETKTTGGRKGLSRRGLFIVPFGLTTTLE